MSNVLIGIIGVILFIGLALAGALFLGPRFQESTNNSQAAAALQTATQTAAAYNLYRLQEGVDHDTGKVTDTDVLFTKGYLKAGIGNRYVSGAPFLIDANGSGNGSSNVPVLAGVILTGDESSKAVCAAIDRQSGRIGSGEQFDATPRSFASTSLVGRAGCQYNGANYVAFVKI